METRVKEKANKQIKQRVESRNWCLVDAKGKVLGVLATKIAVILMGKHKSTWQPYLDVGDNVIVINASKVDVTGRKEEQKKYYHYSGYPGGLKVETLKDLRERKPADIIYHAVAGMLPKNRLRKVRLANLYIYGGEENPHQNQSNLKKDA